MGSINDDSELGADSCGSVSDTFEDMMTGTCDGGWYRKFSECIHDISEGRIDLIRNPLANAVKLFLSKDGTITIPALSDRDYPTPTIPAVLKHGECCSISADEIPNWHNRGEVLVGATWTLALTPRIYPIDRGIKKNMDSKECETAIQADDKLVEKQDCRPKHINLVFVHRPTPQSGGYPPSVATLLNTMKLMPFNSCPPDSVGKAQATDDLGRGTQLFQVLETIKKDFGIQVLAHPHLRPQWVCIEFSDNQGNITEVTFAEVMDAIAMNLDACWDWAGDRVLLQPRPGCV